MFDWSGKNEDRSGKSQGILISCVSGNPGLWGHVLKRSPGIIRKSRVSNPGSGFLSSATWPSIPQKHYNGLINQS